EMGADNSPYNAISAMAIEPTTLHLAPGSPEELTREGFEAALADVDLAKLRRGKVRYGEVKKLKRRLLEKAFENFRNRGSEERRARFKEFGDRESAWLNDYAFFRALVEANNGYEAWDQWAKEQRSVELARAWLGHQSPERQEEHSKREDCFRYVQWVAHEQWSETKRYAEERGVGLMGDIPFGVSYYSADVFTRPGQFALDWFGGAPPETHFKDDKFTQKWGQNWGIPLYRWPKMREGNFDWWRQRIRAVANCFHLFRIDHALGFYRIYA